ESLQPPRPGESQWFRSYGTSGRACDREIATDRCARNEPAERPAEHKNGRYEADEAPFQLAADGEYHRKIRLRRGFDQHREDGRSEHHRDVREHSPEFCAICIAAEFS